MTQYYVNFADFLIKFVFITHLKGAYIAWSKKLVRRFIGSMDREDPDKFIGTRESVKLGLVWQTEAFECRKNSFS